MRRLVPVALGVAACGDEGLVGTWTVELACEEGTDAEAWPSCASDPLSVVELDDDGPPTGTHRTLFPGVPRDDGGATGIGGFVHGGWDRGALVLTLVGDEDDPTVSEGDRAQWRGRVLQLVGTPASVAWGATWTFGDGQVVEVGGTAVVRRTER